MHREANTTALAFEERESFIARSDSKDTGSPAQICLPDLGFSQMFLSSGRGAGMWKPWQAGCHWRALELGALGNGMVKERQHWIFLDSGPFASERVPLFWI